MVREKQKKLGIEDRLKKFEEQLRQELLTAEKYKNAEFAPPLVNIAEPPPQESELIELSGD